MILLGLSVLPSSGQYLLSYWNFNNDIPLYNNGYLGVFCEIDNGYGEVYNSSSERLSSNSAVGAVFDGPEVYADFSSVIGTTITTTGGAGCGVYGDSSDASMGGSSTASNASLSDSSTQQGSFIVLVSNPVVTSQTVIFKLKSAGYQSLSLSYSSRATASAGVLETWYYSLDGSSYSTVPGGALTPGNGSFQTLTLPLSSITSIDNQEAFYLKVVVTATRGGISSASFDNMQLTAASLAPTPTTTTLSATTLVSQIMAAYNASNSGFVLTKGRYTLTNASNGSFYLFLQNLTRAFTIDFNGSTFVLTDPAKGFLDLESSQNVRIQNGTVNYQTPPFTQGTITGISSDGLTYTVALDTGYPEFADGSHFPVTSTIAANIFDVCRHSVKAGTTDLFSYAKWTQQSAGNYTFVWNKASTNAAVGDHLVIRGIGHHAWYLHFCGNITLSGLLTTGSPDLAYFDAGASASNTYQNLTVTRPTVPPAGAAKLPLISSTTGGIRCMLGKAGPQIINCRFDSMLDDAIAIHGLYSLVTDYSQAGDGTQSIVVTDGFLKSTLPIAAGSLIRFYDMNNNPAGTAQVVSTTQLTNYTPTQTSTRSGFTSWSDHTFYQVIITSLSANFTPAFNQLASSPALNGSNYLVSNVTIGRHRARGIYAKADNGTIQNCIINGSSMQGISLAPDLSAHESDYSHNILIINNTIENCGYQANAAQTSIPFAAIGIYCTGSAPSHSNLTLTTNLVANHNGPNLYLTQIKTMSLSGNLFYSPCAQTPTASSLIQIGYTDTVTLSGNTVQKPGSCLNTSVLIQAIGTNTNSSGFDTGLTMQQ